MATNPIRGIPPERVAEWERYGVDVIDADLRNNRPPHYVVGPPGTGVQAWRWVKYKRAQDQAKAERDALKREQRARERADAERRDQQKKPEVLTLKPTLWGFGIDLKAAWSQCYDWWHSRKGK